MSEIIKIAKCNGQQADAVAVPVSQAYEYWNEYHLEDGSVVRAKLVAVKIFKVEGEFDPEGNPVYIVKHNAITVSTAKPENKKKE